MKIEKTQEEWEQIFGPIAESRMAARNWCERNDKPYDTYLYWEHLLEMQKVSFVELPLPTPDVPPIEENSVVPFRLYFNGFTILIGHSADYTQLTEIIGLMQKLC